MTAQVWVACWGRQNYLTPRINVSSLRINTISNSILDESEKPKTSDLTSYTTFIEKKEFLDWVGNNRFPKYRKAPSLPYKGLVQSHAAILVPRQLPFFVVGNLSNWKREARKLNTLSQFPTPFW